MTNTATTPTPTTRVTIYRFDLEGGPATGGCTMVLFPLRSHYGMNPQRPVAGGITIPSYYEGCAAGRMGNSWIPAKRHNHETYAQRAARWVADGCWVTGQAPTYRKATTEERAKLCALLAVL